jgi:hypothetical protein
MGDDELILRMRLIGELGSPFRPRTPTDAIRGELIASKQVGVGAANPEVPLAGTRDAL